MIESSIILLVLMCHRCCEKFSACVATSIDSLGCLQDVWDPHGRFLRRESEEREKKFGERERKRYIDIDVDIEKREHIVEI